MFFSKRKQRKMEKEAWNRWFYAEVMGGDWHSPPRKFVLEEWLDG